VSNLHSINCVLTLICYLSVDLPLWLETDGLVDYVREYLEGNGLAPPLVQMESAGAGGDDDEEEEEEHAASAAKSSSTNSSNSSSSSGGGDDNKNNQDDDDDDNEEEGENENEEEEEEVELSPAELHEMYQDMFATAVEMVEELLQQESEGEE